jgi:paraquat-inducible protein B
MATSKKETAKTLDSQTDKTSNKPKPPDDETLAQALNDLLEAMSEVVTKYAVPLEWVNENLGTDTAKTTNSKEREAIDDLTEEIADIESKHRLPKKEMNRIIKAVKDELPKMLEMSKRLNFGLSLLHKAEHKLGPLAYTYINRQDNILAQLMNPDSSYCPEPFDTIQDLHSAALNATYVRKAVNQSLKSDDFDIPRILAVEKLSEPIKRILAKCKAYGWPKEAIPDFTLVSYNLYTQLLKEKEIFKDFAKDDLSYLKYLD